MTLIRQLRGDGGCPWDRAQSMRSFRHCLVEECREVAMAIERGDLDNLCEELGDALFAIGFLINLADERGAFALDDVIEHNLEKMVRRHPHVFGDVAASTPEEALAAFEAAKAAERGAG